jgi:hypothetical protein
VICERGTKGGEERGEEVKIMDERTSFRSGMGDSVYGNQAGSMRGRIFPRKRPFVSILAYGFVAGLLILIIVMLAITPDPAWMQGDPNESAVGALHPYEVHDGRLHQLASVPSAGLSQRQVEHIQQVRLRSGTIPRLRTAVALAVARRPRPAFETPRCPRADS